MDLFPIAFLIDGLSVYKNLKNDAVLAGLRESLTKINSAGSNIVRLEAAKAYADVCGMLYESQYKGSLPDYIFDLILYDSNIFSKTCANNAQDMLPKEIYTSAENDLHALYKISEITSEMIKDNFYERCPNFSFLEESLPEYSNEMTVTPVREDWGKEIETIGGFYVKNGVGIYAKYYAFIFDPDKGIQPIQNNDPIRLSDLKKYEMQRSRAIENTVAFIRDLPYNNVLLYGDRGTGKSSTVKAILNEYKDDGLRMIEISKHNIIHISRLIQTLVDIPLKFIVFIDDLSFNEDDKEYGVLKAVIEGSLRARPKNVAIYATTNRRHIIKETFSSRNGNEVHHGDTMDEAVSLSDRFGLTITFMRPGKSDFLSIVRQLADDRHLEIDEQELCSGAELFALKNSGRTPRLARQYVDCVEAGLRMKKSELT